MREKEAYRDNLVRLMEAFPGKELLTVKDLSTYFHKDPRTIVRLFPIKEYGISIATLSRFFKLRRRSNVYL